MRSFVLITYVALSTLSTLQSALIFRHMSLKPPGHSTVIDTLLQDFFVVLTFNNTLMSTVALLGSLVSLPYWLLALFVVTVRLTVLLMLLQWLATSLVRYGYIFHWSIFVDLEDGMIIRVARGFSALLSAGFLAVERLLNGDVDIVTQYKVFIRERAQQFRLRKIDCHVIRTTTQHPLMIVSCPVADRPGHTEE